MYADILSSDCVYSAPSSESLSPLGGHRSPSQIQQHPASLDFFGNTLTPLDFDFYEAKKMTVIIKPPLEPVVMYFDTTGNGTRWKMLANINSDEFSVEILPNVFAIFCFTGARRSFKNRYFGIFQLCQIIEERSKVRGQLVSLGGVLTLQQGLP